MDLVRQKHYYFVHDLQQAFSPMTSTTPNGQDSGFPIIAVAIIGIFATGFLLVSYYVFVIKCCLNWHTIDLLLRRFSFSRSSRMDVPNLTLNVYSTPQLLIDHDENNRRGLDETVIRSIPIFRYTKNSDHGSMEKYNCKGSSTTTFCSSECAVCLNEFQEEEKLRIIPNCGHFFHIDCIDVWLQNNANCPLCRNSCISHDDVVTSRFCGMGCPQQIMPPLASPPQNPNPNRLTAAGGGNFIPAAPGRDDEEEDYLVIKINCEHNQTYDDDMRKRILMMSSSGELSTPSINYQYSSSMITPSPSPRKLLLEPLKVSQKRKKKFHPLSSMAKGDECIDTRKKDIDQFEIQPIRRSISMDSAADPHLWIHIFI